MLFRSNPPVVAQSPRGGPNPPWWPKPPVVAQSPRGGPTPPRGGPTPPRGGTQMCLGVGTGALPLQQIFLFPIP